MAASGDTSHLDGEECHPELVKDDAVKDLDLVFRME